MRLAERCAAVALFLGSMVWLPMSQAKLMLSLPLASSSGCQMALGPWNSRAIHSNSTHPSKTGAAATDSHQFVVDWKRLDPSSRVSLVQPS